MTKELYDAMENPFPIIFLGNLDEAGKYFSNFIKHINLQISIPMEAISPREVVVPSASGRSEDTLRNLGFSHIDLESMAPQNGSERIKLLTLLQDPGNQSPYQEAGVLKFTQLTSTKTRIEYFEISRLLRVDLNLVWQEFLSLLENECLLQASTTQRTEELDRPDWFPKGDAALERWKRAWESIRITQDNYKEDYEDMRLEDPEPSLSDLRDAIAAVIGKKYGISTIKNIKRAGQIGWLD